MKRSLMFFSLSLLATALVAFEDKPAFEGADLAKIKAFRAKGAAQAGATQALKSGAAGAAIGTVAAGVGSTAALMAAGGDSAPMFAPLIPIAAGAGGIVGAQAGAAIGAVKGAVSNRGALIGIKDAAKHLSSKYMVSAQSLEASILYDINIEQYKPLFIALDNHNREGVIEAINNLYPQRFGPNWKTNMEHLIARFIKLGETKFKQTTPPKAFKDFVRFMQLGALIAHVYGDKGLVQTSNLNALVTLGISAYNAFNITSIKYFTIPIIKKTIYK